MPDLLVYEPGEKSTNVTLNLGFQGMSLKTGVTNYLKSNFLKTACVPIPFIKEVFDILKCPCNGLKVDGMPTLNLRLDGDNLFTFNSSEYFIYPIVTKHVIQV
jgi:hypothetical protein